MSGKTVNIQLVHLLLILGKLESIGFFHQVIGYLKIEIG